MNSRNTAIAVIGVFVLAALAMCVVSDDSDAAGVSIENVIYNQEEDRFEITFSEALYGYWTFEVKLDGASVGYGEGNNPKVSVIGLHPYEGVTVMPDETYLLVATCGADTVTYNIETFKAEAVAGTGGHVTGSGVFVSGQAVTLVAVTHPGYTFAGWYNGSTFVSSDASYTFNIQADTTLNARWVSDSPSPTPTPTPEPEPEVPVVPDKDDGTYPYGDGSMTITTSTDGSKTVEINQPVKDGTETEVQKFDSDGKYIGSEITTETNTVIDGSNVTTKVVETKDSTAQTSSKLTQSAAVSKDGTVETTSITLEDGSGIVNAVSETVIYTGSDGTVTEEKVNQALAQIGAVASKDSKVGVNLLAPEQQGQTSSVTVAPSSLKVLADAGVVIRVGTENMLIDLDPSTVGTLSAKEGDITVTIGEADKTKLSPNQQKKVGDSPVYTIDLKAGDEDIHQLGGKATVTLPYELKAGQNPNSVKVYYVDDDGKLTQMVTTYDEVSKTVSFETTHFSVYMIGDDSSVVDPSEDDDKGGISATVIAIAIVVVVVVIAAAAFMFSRRP